jgi:oligopeptide/dipeptide ABC transporter ATP-binding protein
LLSCVPRVEARSAELRAIPGAVADLVRPPSGCRFHPRCPFATEECRRGPIPLLPIGDDRWSACIHHTRLAGAGDGGRLTEASEPTLVGRNADAD